jgi:hypothetical protein
MFAAQDFRKKASECAESAKLTDVASERRELQQSEHSLNSMAQNEDWLSANFDKIIRSQDVAVRDDTAKPADGPAVAETEDHILRCLGAAVIMSWNTIPTKLRRELFDTAGSLGDLPQTVSLRGQIARFLHDHKNDEASAAGRPVAK